jgi:protoheme IX farnesyltransferase
VSKVRLADLVQLTKPRITAMVLLTAAAGYWLAPKDGQEASLRSLWLLLGTALVVGSANTMNMVIERDIDGRMRRTRNRPLPAGRLSLATAVIFGAVLGLLSLPVLAFGVNLLTCALGVLSFVIYVALYTPMKQRSPIALVVGAVPGAMPPLMGWTAATGRVDLSGLVLFGILFFWQIPHFLAISLYRTEEMARAGYKVTAAEQGRHVAKARIVLYLAALWPISLLPGPLQLGKGGPFYVVLAALAGAVFFYWGLWGLRREAGPRWARSLFFVSLLHLTVVSVALVCGRLWGGP